MHGMRAIVHGLCGGLGGRHTECACYLGAPSDKLRQAFGRRIAIKAIVFILRKLHEEIKLGLAAL
jgi:hypothetical protein